MKNVEDIYLAKVSLDCTVGGDRRTEAEISFLFGRRAEQFSSLMRSVMSRAVGMLATTMDETHKKEVAVGACSMIG